MSRISASLPFLLGLALVAVAAATPNGTPAPKNPVKPGRQAFQHGAHTEAFGKMGISCTDCHSFAWKRDPSDPLAQGVEKGRLVPTFNVCHACHLEQIALPRRNQCTLCHQDLAPITPASHRNNWRLRHGAFAGNAPDSCKECHGEGSCKECHVQRDTLKPAVHRPNFRLTHSVEARARPQSCAACHSSTKFCSDCHSGTRK